MTTESIERRVLGGIRFVDAVTLQRLDGVLHVSSDTASFLRNRAGDHVILAADGLETHSDVFDVPSVPSIPPAPPIPGAIALGSEQITLTVHDPADRYLARQTTVVLPRDADPLNASDPASLFTPMPVRMYPAPNGSTWPGWAVVRATVRPAAAPGDTGNERLANALLRVVRVSDGVLIGSGMSDARGEALVGVAGIPITSFGVGPGPVLETTVDVVIQVIADAAATGAPDPDDMEQRRAALLVKTSPLIELASGRVVQTIV